VRCSRYCFFVSAVGTPVLEKLADLAFAQLTAGLGLRTGDLRPRIHDYADTCLMPTSGRSACSAVVSGLKMSA
jgi:hypothetical protein